MYSIGMLKRPDPTGELLLGMWDTAKKVPGGKAMFSKVVGRMAPYTATIDARVQELRSGYARVELRDRPAVRNHLGSVHAIALANLAEETTGLAMLSSLSPGLRGIIKSLHVDYLKKARGTLNAVCEAPPLQGEDRREYEVRTDICNEAGEVVAQGIAVWVIGR